MAHNKAMKNRSKPYMISENKVLVDYSSIYCDSPASLLKSDLFREVTRMLLARLERKESHLYDYLRESFPSKDAEGVLDAVINLFRLLATHSAEEIRGFSEEFRPALSRCGLLCELKDEVYNFWVRVEKIAYMNVPIRSTEIDSDMHYAQFIGTNEKLKNTVLFTFLKIFK